MDASRPANKVKLVYKLFYAPESASMGVRVLLEEIGVDYHLLETSIAMDEPRPPEQLAINPNGWVPVLMWGDHAMYGGAAIAIFLCDRHAQAGLAPSLDDPTRALFLQTMVYFSSSVQTAFQLTYYPDCFAETPVGQQEARQRGNRRLRETWSVIDTQIGDAQWVLGDQFSAVDIYLYMLTTWLEPAQGHPELAEFPNVERVAAAVAKRPSVQLVYEL